jgi:hypothetical protein
MKAGGQALAGRWRRWGGILCVGVAGFAPLRLPAAGLPGSLQTTNLETVIYGSDFFKPVATLKVERVFTDHRRMGFFRVKLLPVLVADGVHVEFTESRPQTNWLDGFRFDPAPGVARHAVEWRDFSVSFGREPAPRLRANRVHPALNTDSIVCSLEGVTVQAGDQPLSLPKAELRAEAQSGTVVWMRANEVIQLDLFTGQCRTNSITEKSHEKL